MPQLYKIHVKSACLHLYCKAAVNTICSGYYYTIIQPATSANKFLGKKFHSQKLDCTIKSLSVVHSNQKHLLIWQPCMLLIEGETLNSILRETG